MVRSSQTPLGQFTIVPLGTILVQQSIPTGIIRVPQSLPTGTFVTIHCLLILQVLRMHGAFLTKPLGQFTIVPTRNYSCATINPNRDYSCVTITPNRDFCDNSLSSDRSSAADAWCVPYNAIRANLLLFPPGTTLVLQLFHQELFVCHNHSQQGPLWKISVFVTCEYSRTCSFFVYN